MNKNKDFSQTANSDSLTHTKTALENKGFTVISVDRLEDVKPTVINLIPKGSEVFTATSVTAKESGVEDLIENSGDYKSVRQEFMPMYGDESKKIQMRRIGSAMDYVIGSVHAVTEDGQVVTASKTGSQLSAYVYGANHVIWLVGTQKIVADLNEALKRIETYTLPLESKRAKEAYGFESEINKLLIVRGDVTPGRNTIIFINQNVGF